MDTATRDDVLDWLTGTLGIVLAVIAWLIVLLAYVRIVQKAGYSGWWVLIGLVPVVNVVMFLVFAFSRWPVLREVDDLRRRDR